MIFVLWFLLWLSRVGANHLQCPVGHGRGAGTLFRHIPNGEAGVEGSHKRITGEMLHETYVNKLGWTFAGSMEREVWSFARGFEVKLVCKEAGNH